MNRDPVEGFVEEYVFCAESEWGSGGVSGGVGGAVTWNIGLHVAVM